MTLTRQHLSRDVSKSLQMPRNDSAKLIETLPDLMKSTLAPDSNSIKRLVEVHVLEKSGKGTGRVEAAWGVPDCRYSP